VPQCYVVRTLPIFSPHTRSHAFPLLWCGRSGIYSCRIIFHCASAVNGKCVRVLTELVADMSWSAKDVQRLPVNMSSLFWSIKSEIRSSDVGGDENCCLLTHGTAQPLEVYEMNNN
jgi:hypothetical protein